MNTNLIICFLILIGTVKINADFSNIQVTEVTEIKQDIVEYSVQQETIKLPWSDCTKIHKLFEKKFSFSEKQIKKENKIYEEYRKFSLKNNKLNNFSMQFVEKENENTKAEMLISSVIDLFASNYNNKINDPLSIHFKKQQQFFNKMKTWDYRSYYKKAYENDVFKNNYPLNK